MTSSSHIVQEQAPLRHEGLLSLIYERLPPYGVDIFIGGREVARDVDLLQEKGITTVVNCAVNLDLNYVTENLAAKGGRGVDYGSGALRYYKIGLIDGPGNPDTMILAGYYLLRGALEQVMPDKTSYPRRERGNVLVNCRGGRSRSVAIVALLLHMTVPERFPTIDEALAHVRTQRELDPAEWYKAPKPMMIEAVRRAARWIRTIDAETMPTEPSAAVVPVK